MPSRLSQWLIWQDSRDASGRFIDDALYRTGETVHVAALIGSQVLLFDGRESEKRLRAGIRSSRHSGALP